MNCRICQEEIKKGQPYCDVVEYDEDWEQKSLGHYHVSCYREKFMLNVGKAKQFIEKSMAKYTG